MDANCSEYNDPDFKNSIETLLDLSRPVQQPPVLEQQIHAKNIKGINFDAVKNNWYGKQNYVPCSADALVYQNRKLYLIEFKSGKNKNIMRKVYDSIIMLVDKGKITIAESRDNLTYIIVNPSFLCEKFIDKSIGRADLYTNDKPWENRYLKRYLKNYGLNDIEGFFASKIYPMSPEMFDDFIVSEKWK